ncbi:flagellar basal body rod protein FlgF [Alkalilimnicola ehrlichii MLHE-1]|uniref:Flagellar basal-body rod protein FlgF n=1 Tax=Alkalilimnicola ehrlichii (strain ATCC BAA-1101 / DSM 17681 / MLHE-1) TaxID=187272 RepID=Q0AA86_ALKEH|nr:flagellar basal body rod protein FlgF [Alkalilimnicola ehrlichii]ABI56251.1 flagellar basal-body rod protein FlgF [Alkalilimnicola ehrlichii MLHE-1]
MDRLVYLAMTGAKHTLEAQQHNNHNLANVDTPGFRADLDALMSAPVRGPGHDARAYSEALTVGSDFRQGGIVQTGRALDVAIDGDGWLAVQAPDGGEAYTRRGDLQIADGGLLTTGDGHLVMGEAGPVAIPPADEIEIGADGTLSIIPAGQNPDQWVELDRLKLVDPALQDLRKDNDGLFRLVDGGEAEADAGVRLVSGAYEGSNVNMVDALVKMIDHARQFETYVKMMTAAEENDQTSAQLLRNS